MVEESEFGRGLVVCLVKFAEHFGNKSAQRIADIHFWHESLGEDDSKLNQYGRSVAISVQAFKEVWLISRGSYETGLAALIEMWASGASDHLYDIEVPEKMAKRHLKFAASVANLQKLGLEVGHGFTNKPWTFEIFVGLKNATRTIALGLDKIIGLPDADLGEW